MRVFIATKPSEAFLDELIRIRAHLKKEFSSGINWVKPENLHITHAFLGDVSPDKCKAIIERMKAVKFEKFFVSAGNLGCFPLKGKPSIIWLGIKEGADKLVEVAEKLRSDAISEGFLFKNDFSPHITLGRVRRDEIISKSVNEVFGQTVKLIDRNEIVYLIEKYL